jgi:ABC-type bacteriocin/lantibiotic exporter with double-glycine peptidase domain
MAASSTKSNKSSLNRILKVISLERAETSAIYFFAILNGIIDLSLPLGIQSIISFVLGGAVSTSLVILIILVVLGVFFNGLLHVNQMRLIEKIQQKIFTRYSFEFADRIPKLNLKSVDGYYLPELVNRFFDVLTLQKSISSLLLDIPVALIQIIFGLLLLSFYHPVFIFFGLALLLILYVILSISGSRGLETSLQESDYKYKLVSWLQEMGRVVHSFKFSTNTELNIHRTDELVSGYLESRTAHFKILLFQYWSLISFKVIITAVMLGVGSYLLVTQQLNIGQFIAAEIVILMVISSVEKIIVYLDKVYDVLTSLEKLDKITDKPIEKDGKIALIPKEAGLSIEMKSVSFSYDDESDEVLENINLSIKPNETICLKGPSSSGKSTLLRLMGGAFREFSGQIMFNGIPVNDYVLDSLRSQKGILLSRQDIFQGTLLENITMGNLAIHPNEIVELTNQLGIDDLFTEFQDGFATQLDATGRRLSRRMKQKILLLRALINKPKLLLLQDPFEGLEEDTKVKLIDYLLAPDRIHTLVVTTNSQRFASQCDRIIHLKAGKIA